jgi:nitroimidazol reductase NimA-like FMN-containing flavoprotein (pyridoxamine 5'-phosphate oxidase superfamily)
VPSSEAIDLSAHARALLDENRYLTLGTADADGRPWTTPVYFRAAGLRDFFWVSLADAEHSRHLGIRPQVSLVVFDSTVPPYHGRAVYAAGSAAEVVQGELDAALRVYPGSTNREIPPLTAVDVSAPSPYRIYRATAEQLWVLCPREPGAPCPLHGLAGDHRTAVPVDR